MLAPDNPALASGPPMADLAHYPAAQSILSLQHDSNGVTVGIAERLVRVDYSRYMEDREGMHLLDRRPARPDMAAALGYAQSTERASDPD